MTGLPIAACAGGPATEPPAAPGPAPSWQEAANASYAGALRAPVNLVDGLWQGGACAEGGASTPGAGLVRDFLLSGDLGGDGAEESAVLIWTSSGGSGTFDYLVVLGRDAVGAVRERASAPLGARVKVRAANIVDDGVPGNASALDQDFALYGHNAADCAPPDPPALASAAPTAPNEVTVSWVAPQGATEFAIERAAGSAGTYTRVGRAAAPASTFVDRDVSGGTTYHYLVRALAGDCESAPAEEARATATGRCAGARLRRARVGHGRAGFDLHARPRVGSGRRALRWASRSTTSSAARPPTSPPRRRTASPGALQGRPTSTSPRSSRGRRTSTSSARRTPRRARARRTCGGDPPRPRVPPSGRRGTSGARGRCRSRPTTSPARAPHWTSPTPAASTTSSSTSSSRTRTSAISSSS